MLKQIKERILNRDDFWGNLFRNVITIFSGNVFASFLSFISSFLILQTLSTSDYGKIVIAINYMNMIDLLVNFQSWTGVVKFGSEALENKKTNLASIIKAGMSLDLSTSFLGTVLGITLLPLISMIFNWDKQISLFCFCFCFEILFHLDGTFTGIFRLFDKFKYVSIHLVINELIKLFIILSLYFTHCQNILLYVICYVCLDVIKFSSFVIIGLLLLHKRIGLKNIIRAKYSELDKKFWQFTIWANLASTVDAPIKYCDTFFLSLLSIELVSAYNVFKKIIAIFGMTITPISQAIMPQLAKLIAAGKQKESYFKMHKLRNLIFVIGVPFIILLGLFAPILLRIANKSDLIQYLWILYFLLGINLIAYCYLGIHPLFSAFGFSKYDFFITLTSNLVYLIIISLLIHHISVLAIVIGTFVQLLITIISKEFILRISVKQQ